MNVVRNDPTIHTSISLLCGGDLLLICFIFSWAISYLFSTSPNFSTILRNRRVATERAISCTSDLLIRDTCSRRLPWTAARSLSPLRALFRFQFVFVNALAARPLAESWRRLNQAHIRKVLSTSDLLECFDVLPLNINRWWWTLACKMCNRKCRCSS